MTTHESAQLPDPPTDDLYLPMEIADESVTRTEQTVASAMETAEFKAISAEIERLFGVNEDSTRADLEALGEEAQNKIESLIEAFEYPFMLSDIKSLLYFVNCLLYRLSASMHFADYLEENGHEGIARYLRRLVSMTPLDEFPPES